MLPGFLVRMLRRGGYRARMGDRFALYPRSVIEAFAQGSFVWVHAVSVGEVQVAGQLMREWRKVDPAIRFCFSTTSSTGWKMAEKEVREGDVLIYNPLDFPNFVKSALKTVRPRAIVLTESEIWPIFIRTAASYRIPLFLINARVSDRSAPRYAKGKWFFKDVFSAFTRIFAQSALDRARLLAAGAPEDRIEVTGSFKFDVARRNPAKEEELRAWVATDRPILLGGSTWPGEDVVLLEIEKSLLGTVPEEKKPVLVLAPRHFEKADAVEANIRAAGFSCVRRSRGEKGPADGAVFLADTTGELMGLYGIASAVFVGKSLCEHGSQNMIEPCLCGKPTVVGPYTENFRPVMSDLLEGGGLKQVADAEELKRVITDWFTKGDEGLGARAQAAVARRTGVVPACLSAIRSALVCLVVCLGAVCAQALDIPHETLTTNIVVRVNPKLKAVRLAGAYIAMFERPDAVNVYLADEEAERYAPFFTGAKLPCDTAATAPTNAVYDIVFVGHVPQADAWAPLTARLKTRGVLAVAFDVQKLSMGRFRDILKAVPGKEVHLWMPGEKDWLLTMRAKPFALKMSAALEFFSQSDALISGDAESAGCGSIQELFASYVGRREDVLPAFEKANLEAPVRPEFFLPLDMPDIPWILPDEDTDADIVVSVADGIRRLQGVRRIAVTGNAAADAHKMEEAIASWSLANDSNPHDTLLQSRLYQLAVNARALANFGRQVDAAQCYDILFAVTPSDLAVAEEYYNILLMLQRLDDAKKVRKHIDTNLFRLRRMKVEEREREKKE